VKVNKKFLIVIILICIMLSGSGAIAEEEQVNRNVYLVTINRYTLQDLEYMPNLNEIINNGSIGLMNTRGFSNYNGAESYLSINSSNKAISGYEGTETYNVNDRYREIYERRLGPISRESALANISLNSIIEKNKSNNYMPYIGALGDNVHEKGYYTASYGNADTIDYIRRPSSLIPMDSRGLIDYGNVDNILINDINMPYGFRTDFDKILEETIEIKDKASLIVIDTGDLDRLHFYSRQMSEDIFMERRQDILTKVDDFIGALKNNIDKKNSLLMIVSPNSGDERVEGSKLSPIILWGSEVSNGILLSSTTKHDGIVTNLDIGPKIAEFLDTPKVGMVGNTISSKNVDKNLQHINNLNDRVNVTYTSRYKTLMFFSILAIIVILLTTIVLLLKISITDYLYKVTSFLLTLIVSIPLTLILSSFFNVNSISKFVILNIIFLFVISFTFYKLKRQDRLFMILGLTYIILVIDLMTNNSISQYSILAPDPIIGARYFGIGNELVGIFLGTTAILLGFILNKKGNKFITVVLLVFSVILVGHPKLGANVGGSISLLFASLYFVLELRNKSINLKRIISLGLFVVLFILFMGYIDIKFNSTPTHLGKGLLMVVGEKGTGISIIIRKVLMNIKLMGSSIWAKTLLLATIVNIAIIFILGDRVEDIYNNKKGVSIGLISAVVGSVMGFLFNDSGVLLSALTMIFATIILLMLLIDNERENCMK